MLKFLIQASLMNSYIGHKCKKHKTGSHETEIPT